MRISRLHLQPPLGPETKTRVTGDRAHYLSRVLRLKPGHEITVFDGRGGEYLASVGTVTRHAVELLLGAHRAVERESPLEITLALGLSRGERMDFAIQKATELGVQTVAPLVTERCGVVLSAERAAQRRHHWEKIVISASEQCGRNRLAMVQPVLGIDDWISLRAPKPGLVFVPDGESAGPALQHPGDRVTLLVGPEGGLSAAELRRVAQAGFQPVQLGPRVLRAETAAIAALATVQACWGDLGGLVVAGRQ
ncbi:MAG: 16S rRNA (uracil(1498)-N(3))-methyltransferase [Gammaproteobacteria bacterium]|nr:16S rRNA (uracil(1498)-N(3))-methyltransferase [Gammaproteobacteria bacterium]